MKTPRPNLESLKNKKVVIVGGGFGGLSAAKALGGKKGVEVLLIDRQNYHLFQPLLYQVATAGLSPAEIAYPIRAVLAHDRNIQVELSEVTGVDLAARVVKCGDRSYSYDYVVIACGAKHSYFGHDEWEEYAPGLKTLEQATEIRRRVLLAFENAEKETDVDQQKRHQTFVIVGGGPTGVEMAGAIAEISRFTLEKDFRRIDPANTRVILIEAGQRVLQAFSPELSRRATRDLEKMGVQVWTSTRVTQIEKDSVVLGEEVLKAHTVIWAAGVQPSSLGKKLGVELDRIGRVVVGKDLALPSFSNAFVVGDQASFMWGDAPLPGLAPVAMQQGRHVARVILSEIQGKARPDFQYLDKGMMATVGRKKAVVQFGKLQFAGLFAWVAWLFIHIYYLIGFKNRLFVFMQWGWSYLTFQRGARLIVGKEWRVSKPRDSFR